MTEHDKLFRHEAVKAQDIMNSKTHLALLPSWCATNALLASFGKEIIMKRELTPEELAAVAGGTGDGRGGNTGVEGIV
ncbi:hypothetical protein [Altericroceibacterium xinjiangense]|uniref:hypothetical protein n=1 Tax=Altericroceibacterium xinjiangense TaxID=762261 RepID=UPI000F7F123A|nr:hypothetical protein [Altericroceibacterium xinjiangense]